MNSISVVIIGAGPAGLCLLRHLKSVTNVHAVCYEKAAYLGGTWLYSDRAGRDARGDPVHSSMYKNLRCNFPKEIMAFPDFPFERHLPSFITHGETLEYLKQYAEHFDLLDSIQFNTRVECVKPIRNNGEEWKVSTRDVRHDNVVQRSIHDYVVVCCGHFSAPFIPSIPGQEEFRGRTLHSHDYRVSKEFKGQALALMGANFSGTDIADDLSSSVEKIYLCHNNERLNAVLPFNVEQRRSIKTLKARTMVLDDDSEVAIDTLMYCTGYRYHTPFLSPECQLPVVDGRMTTLYKHIFHTHFPSLSIMGVCKNCSPFLCMHLQAQLIANVVSGCVSLPTRPEMEEEIQADFQKRLELGWPVRKAHWLADLQWEYYDDLSLTSGGRRLPGWFQHMFQINVGNKLANITTYKDYTFRITGLDSFEYWLQDNEQERITING